MLECRLIDDPVGFQCVEQIRPEVLLRSDFFTLPKDLAKSSPFDTVGT
jgi:hypothetical protein